MKSILLTLLSSFAVLHSSFSAQPNIVFMYADNLGYGDLGCYGNKEVKTPHLDRLAAEGVRCTDFYVVTSTCTVSRGAVLTGRHPLRNGLLHQLVVEENWHGVGLPHRERIMPQYLKDAGYATACFGKWNIGFAPGSRPTERGFDKFLGCRSGNINYFTHTYHGEYDLFRETEPHHMEGYSGDIFAEAAAEFISRQSAAKRPFFVYLPFNAPHYVSSINVLKGEKPQWQAPDRAFAAYGWNPAETDEKRRYLAVITALDDMSAGCSPRSMPPGSVRTRSWPSSPTWAPFCGPRTASASPARASIAMALRLCMKAASACPPSSAGPARSLLAACRRPC